MIRKTKSMGIIKREAVSSVGLSDLDNILAYYLDKTTLLFDGVNDSFNNISVISWRSVLLVEQTGGPGENHRPVASH